MASLDRAVGIDLGTTNSEVAWLPPDERDLVIFGDRFGRRTVPSAVAWDEKASAFLVGHAAKAKRGSKHAPVESIKRRMGQKASVTIGPHELSPEEVSSKILAELAARMRETLATRAKAIDPTLDLPLSRAVITVPAYFDAPQVEATRRAGELAGLEVIGILQEPTAAAIYHTWKRRLAEGTFLVYDLGGGTFDVSVLRCLDGEYQVLAIDGDNFLGGDDFDRRYAEHLRKVLVDRGYVLDLDVKGSEEDRALFGRLVHLAQEIKESLSTAEVVHVSKNDFMVDKAGESVSFDDDVGRIDYERIVDDLVGTTLACCDRALARATEIAGVGLSDVDHVILVGGSTRVPLVVRKVTEKYCKDGQEPLRDDVDTCVALGAAIHAAHVGGTVLARDEIALRITTPMVAQGRKLRLGLEALSVPESASRVAVWDGDHPLAEGPIGRDPVRFDLELGESDETRATLVLSSSIGTPVAELPLPLTRGDLRPRPTALSRASVIAKDIALEVVRAGRRERRVLLAHGTGLPALAHHVFYTADQTGAVVLRLLQNRLPIKTLVVEVPRELPLGSPVEIEVRCDESMRLEARARVGTQDIQAHIEPPATSNGDEEDVDALLEQVERARRALWGGLGAEFAREAELLAGSIREVVYTDPDKLRALAGRLKHLVEEYHGGAEETLVPPMARMEDAFDVLRRIVYRSKAQLLGMDRREWEERVETLHDKALTAHDENDGAAWRRVWNEVQALAETAYQEEFSQLRLDDPAYVQRRIVDLSWRAQRLEESVRDLETSRTDEIAALQIREQARVVGWLEDAVTTPLRAFGKEPPTAELSAVRRSLEQIESEMERIEQAIARIPAMGLVTDRGGG